MSDRETADFLATVPLLAGRDDDDLMALARLVRRRTVREGELLWRQGGDARELVFLEDGALTASLHLPGNRTVEIWTAGRGETIGEIALLDGKGHTMSVRVTETATMLALGRVEFAALLARQDPSSFRLKRDLASLFTSRLRSQLQRLAASLGDEMDGPGAEDAARTFAELEPCGPPDSKYVRRMATFHDFDALALWGFLTSGTYATCPPGRTLLAEGAPSAACYLTMNGAVEKVLHPGRSAHPHRARGSGQGVRVREPDRWSRVPGRRDHARANAAPRPAARAVREDLQRGGSGLPRLPRRDPAGAGELAASVAASARAPRGQRVTASSRSPVNVAPHAGTIHR